jgi:polysaccharide deacetylase 2 family uncharacterized protein YibQ
MSRAAIALAALLAAVPLPLCAQDRPRIAIIIDDLGYALAAGERAVSLPGPVTCAILPGTPVARRLAASAAAAGKEILVHLPMQAVAHDDGDEPVSIGLDTTRHGFAQVFEDALDAVPGAVGVNNHRGSLVTRHPGHMLWLMQEIRAREPMFFVDSYTTHRSVALMIAAESGVGAVKRDVFLDNDASPEAIREAFERLKRLAEARGAAVAIGHPHEHTLALLERELPRLADEGFELVPISALAMQR